MSWLKSIQETLGIIHDTQSAKQSQSEDFYNENTFVGAVFRNNRAKIEELCYNHKKQRYNYDRMLRHDRRGAVGECCFHICFLFPSEENLEMAKWLLAKNPRLIDSIYEDIYNAPENGSDLPTYSPSPYKGENALHMAIANNFTIDSLEWLIQLSPALVHGRTTGSFFRPPPPDSINVHCAFGEYPLSFAVSLNRPDMVKYLILQGGANVLARDTDGNTAMHLAVLHKRKEMIELLSSLWGCIQARRKALHDHENRGTFLPTDPNFDNPLVPLYDYGTDDDVSYDLQLTQIPNDEGYTPLVLAAKYGDIETFKYIWERAREISWKYWHVTAYKYPLEHIDDIWDIIKERDRKIPEESKPPTVYPDSDEEEHEQDKNPRVPPPPSLLARANNKTVEGGTPTVPLPRRKSISTVEKNGTRTTKFGNLSARTALQLLTDQDFEYEAKEIPVMRELLEHKWNRYAKRKFMVRFLIVFVYLIIFLLTVSIRGPQKRIPFAIFDRTPSVVSFLGLGRFAICSSSIIPSVHPWQWWSDMISPQGDVSNLLCTIGSYGEVIVILGAVLKLFETLSELYWVGFYYFSNARGATIFERYMSIAFSSSIFGTMLFEYLGIDYWSKLFLSIASVLGPFYILWFLLGTRLTGPFVVMLWKMFTIDLPRFLSIAVILLFGFTQAFFVQFSHQGFTLFFKKFLIVFNDMVGVEPPIELDNQADESHLTLINENILIVQHNYSGTNLLNDNNNPPNSSHGLVTTHDNDIDANITFLGFWITYILLANVVLLNLLIAMMGDTYGKIKDTAEAQWFLERARIILQIETWMSHAERLTTANQYYGIHVDRDTGKKNIYLLSEHKDAEKFEAEEFNEKTQKLSEDYRALRKSYEEKMKKGPSKSKGKKTDTVMNDEDEEENISNVSSTANIRQRGRGKVDVSETANSISNGNRRGGGIRSQSRKRN